MSDEPSRPPRTKRDLGPEAQIAARKARRERFLGLFDFTEGHGLEIGPLDAALSDPDIDDVRYVDLYDTAGVRAHYADNVNVIPELIPEIDYALVDGERTRSLAEAAAPGAPYDWVIASHVIEHVPDYIGWLKQIAEVTANGGALVLAIPDRRYCFDRHRPPTTTGQALAAYEAGDVRPTVRAVYDHFRSAITVDTAALWAGERPPGREAAQYDQDDVAAALDRVRAGEYVNTHVWTFTPQGFLAQVTELRELGLCDWYVETMNEPQRALEFHVVLRKLATGSAPADFTEPALESDLPDWLLAEWSTAERVRQLEDTVQVLRRRNRRLRSRLDRLERSARMRLGTALVAPAAAVRRRLRRRR
jgi:SAM-dependent methyltransferase